MAVYAPCMFCEKTDSPLTKEDVLPKWLVKELSGSHETRFQYGAGSYRPGRFAAQDFDHERQNVGNLGVVTRGPCQRCNNEWMSQLEQRAKVVVAPLLKGQPTTLDLKQIATLAEWTTKTAVCWDYVRPDRRYFTQAERGTLYKTLSAAPPRTLSLLPGTRVYVARYRGPQVTASIAGKLILPVTTSAAPPHGFVSPCANNL